MVEEKLSNRQIEETILQSYRELIKKMEDLQKQYAGVEPDLIVCINAIRLVQLFIDANKDAEKKNLAKPFYRLANALDDYARGSYPKLFDWEGRKPSNRAPGLSDTKVGAFAAAAYKLLARTRMKSDERAMFVVMELLKLKITSTNGAEEITAQTVINWGKAMEREKNPETADVYKNCLAEAEKGLQKGISKEALKEQIRQILKQLAIVGITKT